MKNEKLRACVLSMLLMAAFVNVSGRVRLSYEVAPDTVNHFLKWSWPVTTQVSDWCVAMLKAFVKQKKKKTWETFLMSSLFSTESGARTRTGAMPKGF